MSRLFHAVQLFFLLCLPFLLTGCFGSPPPLPAAPVDVELANSVAAAETAYAGGAISESAVLYVRALNRARAMDDATLIGENAYNAAACYLALGKFDRAAELLEEARVETLRAHGNTADVLLVMAKVAWLRNQPAEAMKLCQTALTDPTSKPTDAHRQQVHLLRGQIACGAGDTTAANA